MSETSEPIAANQVRLWVDQELDPDSNAYNLTRCLRLRGPLDADALVRAVNALAARHEILRTVFRDESGEVRQHVLPPAPALTGVTPASAVEEERARRAREFALRPFDLRGEPPFRAQLLRVTDDDHRLVLAFHHIAMDAWSLHVFEGELASAYRSLAAHGDWRPDTAPTQFREFTRWQRERLTPENTARHLAYWREALPQELPPDDFLASRPLESTRPGPAATHEATLPPDVVAGLGRLGTTFGTTAFAILHTALQILLERYSGNRHLVIGGTTLNRKLPAFESALGFFVNTVPLHTPLADNPSFGEALARGRETVLGALEHDDLPFDRIAEALFAPSATERGGLYRVALEVQAVPPSGEDPWGELSVEADGFAGETAQRARCDLTFNVLPGPGGTVRLVTEYDSDRFDERYVDGLADALSTLLRHAERAPETPVGDLDLVSPDARERLRTLRSSPPRDTAWEPTSDLVRALAEEHGERVALRTPTERLGFRTLVERAEAVASALVDDGARQGELVGVVADRSVHAITALLGCWLAGCAYVPLEPGEAEERQRWIVADAGATRVLGPPDTAIPGTRTLDVRARAGAGGGGGARATGRVGTPTRPDDLAYAIYTSGTTGRPKATLATHATMLNVRAGLAACFEVPDWRRETVSLNGPLVFDVSLQQLLPLLDGAAVAIVPASVRLDPEALIAYVADAGITLLDVSPAHLRLLLEAGLLEREDLPLRRLITGGEALPAPLWRPLARSGLRVFNCYGPTECTVNTTVQKVDMAAERPLIGTEVHGATLHIADEAQRPVPYGAIGELYIAGAGVGPGYLNQPELTADRFRTLPWGPGGEPVRVYRTGDRVRLAKGGAVEHLGRLDDQVKIRGNRVELREVTATLLTHPGVGAAETVVDDSHPSGPRLYSFAVAGPAVTEEELHRHLTGRLPGYMVPARVRTLAALPTTVSGKTDRTALRALCRHATEPEAPSATTASPTAGSSAPRNGTERRLTALWRDVLALPSAGADADFFSLGGHSLLAARLISRIRREFATRIDYATLRARPTPRLCAEHLGSAPDPAAPSARGGNLLELRTVADDAPLFCFHPLGGDALVYQDLVGALPEHKAVYALFDGRTDPSDPSDRSGWESAAEMLETYATEVAEAAAGRGCHLVGWSLGGLIAHGAATLLERRGVTVHSVSILDAGCSPVPYARPPAPDWAAGPLTVLHTLAPDGAGPVPEEETARLRPDFEGPPDAALGDRLLRAAERLWGVAPAQEPRAVADRAVIASLHNWLFTGWSPQPIDAPVRVVWAADSLRRGLVATTDWSAWTRAGAQETEVEATHYSLIRKPVVDDIAAQVMKTVDEITPGR